MKKITLILFVLFAAYSAVDAQTLDADLKAKQAELAEAEKKVEELTTAVSDLEAQIETGAGWLTGYSGLLGFDFNKSNGWVANPNRDAESSSLNLGLSGYANRITDEFFLRNKGVLTKSWQDIKLTQADRDSGQNLFDKGTVDILNISSLAGKPISEQIAISGLGELNTSLGNFLNPGTLDIGVGVTWTPDIDDLVVVVHPLNYHIAFSGVDGVSSEGALGAKVRADFNREFNVSGKAVKWSSTLTSFVPYGDTGSVIPDQFEEVDGVVTDNLIQESFDADLFEYTWLNTFSFEVWNGIGVGLSLGLRNANFESPETQSFYSLGLSYAY